MKILHYSLGFPPYRTGGMTKYCMDLMEAEYFKNNKVSLLWPGEIKDYSNYIDIKRKMSPMKYNSFESYEIINPLPIPLLNGIKNFSEYTMEKNIEIFDIFFRKEKFDILHIHTFMGLPIEVLKAAKKNNIKIIYTTHDYFGICPKVSLFFENQICMNAESCEYCNYCNKDALSLNKIKFLQSKIYRKIKMLNLIKTLKRFKIAKNSNKENTIVKENKNEYLKLRKYYMNFFSFIDSLHFNSNLTYEIFSRFIDIESKSKIITITHSNIKNIKKIKSTNGIINFTYLGSCTERKGFFYLLNVCEKLNEKYKNKFKLNIYSKTRINKIFLVKHNNYNITELEKIMNKTDFLIVPSIWYETFGFTTIEALSYGVPVILTENVGAKDIIKNGKSGFICKANEKDLYKYMENVINNTKIIDNMNEYINKNVFIKEMNEHSDEIIKLYKNL